MHDPGSFLAALATAQKRGERCAMAELVAVSGSSYRRVGARLLILESGMTRGLLSGGCLEADVAAHAQSVLQSGRPKCVHYDLRDTEAGIWGLGLGCDGVVDVYIESLETNAARRMIAFLTRILDERKSATLRTVFASEEPVGVPVGFRIGVLDGELSRLDSTDPVPVEWESASSIRFLEERIEPPQRLIVCGAGEDAEPLVDMAVQLGWHVVVLDRRDERLARSAFADVRTMAGAPHTSLAKFELDARDAVVTLTHRYEDDLEILAFLYERSLMYLGLLGPRTRSQRLVEEVKSKADGTPVHAGGAIFAPVGIDIGAETPAEIALAIIAEIQAVRSGRAAGFLRDREAPLHPEQHPEPAS